VGPGRSGGLAGLGVDARISYRPGRADGVLHWREPATGQMKPKRFTVPETDFGVIANAQWWDRRVRRLCYGPGD